MRLNRLVFAEVLRSLGIPGVLGLALAVLALVLGVSTLLPARAKLDRERQELVELRAAKGSFGAASAAKAATPQDQLNQFYALFPGQSTAAATLDKVYAAAAANSIALPRGEYALTQEPKTQLAQYRMVLPVRGSYEQIRGFLAAALQAVPTLSLDDIEFRREKIGEAQLEAKIHMTLYLAHES